MTSRVTTKPRTGAAIFVAWRTLNHLEDQTKAAKDAAIASKASADLAQQALLFSNRPNLHVRHIVVNGLESATAGALIHGDAYVTNVGVAQATLLRVHAQWLIVDALPIENPSLTALDHTTSPTEMRPSSFVKLSLPMLALKPEDLASLKAMRLRSFADDRRRLLLVGYIKYSDNVGLRRRYYAYRYSPSRNRFVQVKHPNYNYED